MLPEEFEALKIQYINSAVEYGIATMKGDYKAVNKEWKVMQRTYSKIAKDQKKAEEFLESIFQHDNPSFEDPNIIVWACSHALSNNILVDKAINALRRVVAEANGIVRLDAEMTLKQWEKEGKLGGKSW